MGGGRSYIEKRNARREERKLEPVEPETKFRWDAGAIGPVRPNYVSAPGNERVSTSAAWDEPGDNPRGTLRGTARIAAMEQAIRQYQRNTDGPDRLEVGYGVNAKGDEVVAKWGQPNHVSFTQDEVEALRGGQMTHNHPSKGSFSDPDWHFAAHADLASIRAVSDDNTHELRRPATGWPSSTQINRALGDATRAVRAGYEDRLRAAMNGRSKETVAQINAHMQREFGHQVNMRAATALHVPYQRVWDLQPRAQPGERVMSPPKGHRGFTTFSPSRPGVYNAQKGLR